MSGTTHLPIARTIIGHADDASTATASGAAVGFAAGPNVATPTPGLPYTAGSTLISFDEQLIQQAMTWWVLPPYNGWCSFGLHFSRADELNYPVSGDAAQALVGLDDVGTLDQTFTATSGTASQFRAAFPPDLRPAGPTFFKRAMAPDQSVRDAIFPEPSPAHVVEPKLYLPGRRVCLWVWCGTTTPSGGTMKVVGGLYAMGAVA